MRNTDWVFKCAELCMVGDWGWMDSWGKEGLLGCLDRLGVNCVWFGVVWACIGGGHGFVVAMVSQVDRGNGVCSGMGVYSCMASPCWWLNKW